MLVAVLLHSVSLGWGFFADDYVHLGVLEGWIEHPTMRGWSLFDFGHVAQPDSPLFQQGAFPWWTDADWQGRFFRPLSSVVRRATHAAFGRHALAQHAVSLGLFAAVLALAWRLYRSLGFEPRVALLALAVFAFDDGAVMPVGWIANQNSVLEALGVLGAWLAARYAIAASPPSVESSARAAHSAGAAPSPRPAGSPGTWVFLAFTAALAACLAKESGVLAFAVLAWEWRRARRGCAALAVGCALGYVVAWSLAGFGLRSQGYPTPWGDPAAWSSNLAALSVGAPLSAVSPFMLDLVPTATPARFVVLACALPFTFLLVQAVVRAARSAPHASTCALVFVLGLVPQAGTWPSDRLLFVPLLGAAPLVAHTIVRGLAAHTNERGPAAHTNVRGLAATSLTVRLGAWALVGFALPLSALSLGAREFLMRDVTTRARAAITELELARDGAPRQVVLLQAPSGLVALQPTSVWAGETGDLATHFFPVQMGRRALDVRRLDERTLEIETTGAPFGDELFERVFRTPGGSVAEPPSRRTAAFDVVVLADASGAVRKLRLTFARPLEARELVFVAWRDGRLRVIAPPELGTTLTLAEAEPLVPGMP